MSNHHERGEAAGRELAGAVLGLLSDHPPPRACGTCVLRELAAMLVGVIHYEAVKVHSVEKGTELLQDFCEDVATNTASAMEVDNSLTKVKGMDEAAKDALAELAKLVKEFKGGRHD